MRDLMAIAIIVVCAGCTTMRPVAGTPGELRQRIDAGGLLKPGDSVAIVTVDGKAHRFEVTGVAGGVVQGRADSVHVDQIATLEKRTPNPAQTVTLVLALLSVGALAAAAGLHAGAGGVYH